MKLHNIARYTVPLALGVFLSWEINQSMTVPPAWVIPWLIGSIASAIGVELTGILAGKALVGYWQAGDNLRTVVSAVLLTIYTAAAMYILVADTPIILLPVIAAMVYVLAALDAGLEHRGDIEAEERQRQHELALQQKADNLAVRLAKLETPQPAQPKAQPVATNGLTDGQQRVYHAIMAQPGATNSAIASQLGVSRQYVSKVKGQLNGRLSL